MANNKVQLSDGTVLLDLTGDTVTADALLKGYTAHGKDGVRVVGSYEAYEAKEFDIDVSTLKLVTVPARTMQLEGTTLNITPSTLSGHTLSI